MHMKPKKVKLAKNVGDTLIGLGAVLCVLSFILYVLVATNGGTANGLTIFGGCTLGLLMIITGYLQRISAVLIAFKTAETKIPATPLQ